VTVTGVGGVGKTTLVDQWATGAIARGEISRDNYCFIDLQGFSTSEPISPATALEHLLGHFGISGSDIPSDITERSVLFCERAAARRHFTLVLDNALNEGQIRPLLPLAGPILVIVTGRKDSFSGLRVRGDFEPVNIILDRFDEHDSVELLTRSLSVSSDRDVAAAAKVAEHCCGLPLALGIAASHVRGGEYAITELADKLAEPDVRLTTLSLGDEAVDLIPALSLSYSRLPESGRRAFRLLGLRLGQGIDAYGVALLTGLKIGSAAQVIRQFRSVGLLEAERPDRYSLHDLLREFARELVEEEESPEIRRTALNRMLDGYYGCVNYAFDVKNADNPMVDSAYLKSWETDSPVGRSVVDRYVRIYHDAAQWFAAERANLVDLVKRSCYMSVPPERAPMVAFSMFYFLEAGGHWTEWDEINQAGYRAAEALGDVLAMARLKRNIARLEFVRVRGRSEELKDVITSEEGSEAAIDQCRRAARALEDSAHLYERCNPPPLGEIATVHRELADTYLELARLDPSVSFVRAVDAYRTAEELFRSQEKSDNPIASLSVSLSIAYRELQEYEKAEECLRSALEYARSLNAHGYPKHPRVIGYGLLRWAELCVARGDAAGGVEHFGAAADAFHADNNWLAEARSIAIKGVLLAAMSDMDLAESCLALSLSILTEHASGEAVVVRAWMDRLETAGPAATI
jgi:tetratricopeptide (TPR) repeat protein